MPASLAVRMSSTKALAVIATIQTFSASALGRVRICMVASYPFMTGIWTSMKIRS